MPPSCFILQVDLSYWPLTDENIGLLEPIAHLYRSLNLKHCYYVSNTGVAHIIRLSVNLNNLDIRGCHQLSDDFISSIKIYLPNLKFLNFSDCPLITDMGIAIVMECCVCLCSFHIRNNSSLTDKGLIAMCRNIRASRVLEELGNSLIHDFCYI